MNIKYICIGSNEGFIYWVNLSYSALIKFINEVIGNFK